MNEPLNGKTILVTGGARRVGKILVLASMTKSLAIALAPRVIVNGSALGAILPPSDGRTKTDIIKKCSDWTMG